jgi:5-bromo-4-chloroindolyl phosphate hydrolysis protein
MIAVTLVAVLVFVLGPILFSLIVAAFIILPMYLAVRLFGDKE